MVHQSAPGLECNAVMSTRASGGWVWQISPQSRCLLPPPPEQARREERGGGGGGGGPGNQALNCHSFKSPRVQNNSRSDTTQLAAVLFLFPPCKWSKHQTPPFPPLWIQSCLSWWQEHHCCSLANNGCIESGEENAFCVLFLFLELYVCVCVSVCWVKGGRHGTIKESGSRWKDSSEPDKQAALKVDETHSIGASWAPVWVANHSLAASRGESK